MSDDVRPGNVFSGACPARHVLAVIADKWALLLIHALAHGGTLRTAELRRRVEGISEKMLWRNEETGASVALIRFAKGCGIPQPHYHASNQFMFCLQGKYEYTGTGVTLTAGCFYWNPKGNVHGPAIAHEDTVVVEIYDGPHYPIRPSWYTSDEDAR